MVLLLVFIVIPAVELFLILQIGGRIGLLATALTIIATGVLGVALARSEGLLTLERIRRALAEGRMPAAEIVDGLLILVAAAVLLTPGFLTDAVGLLILFPLTRPFFRALVLTWLAKRMDRRGPPDTL